VPLVAHRQASAFADCVEARRNVEVEHIDGLEENGAPRNLIWTYPVCNCRCAHSNARDSAGPRTSTIQRQSAGAETLGQWMNAVISIKGDSGGTLSVSDAVSLLHATPPEQRSRLAREIFPCDDGAEVMWYLIAI
jgi:hypothetical protein